MKAVRTGHQETKSKISLLENQVKELRGENDRLKKKLKQHAAKENETPAAEEEGVFSGAWSTGVRTGAAKPSASMQGGEVGARVIDDITKPSVPMLNNKKRRTDEGGMDDVNDVDDEVSNHDIRRC